MSENEDGQERTESATPKRLEEARRRGQIPRSRELNSAAVTLAGGGALYVLGTQLGTALSNVMRANLSLTPKQALDVDHLIPALSASGRVALEALVPILGLVALAAVLAPMLLGGWNFSSQALMPDFSRLNPLAGFKRVFSSNGLVELGKSLAKFVVVGFVVVLVLRHDAPQLMSLGREPIGSAIGHAVSLSGHALIAMSSGLLLIAGVDVPYQMWSYAKQMRMSREEIRQEAKESDGSPEVKAQIRRMQQEVAQRRMMEDVPKADVVVTNPTHFAVALRYDDSRMRAPIVVAKGADLIAARIREIATENNVPIFEAPPLARVLHKNVDIGREIPAALYIAVAQVLTYVFQLRAATKGMAQRPVRPDIAVDESAATRS
jgi:flagellar biosynthetic protein FlhB